MRNFVGKIVVPVLFLAIGFGAGFGFFNYYVLPRQEDDVQQVRSNDKYQFISPLYDCEVNGKELINKYIPFEDRIKERIADEVQNDPDLHVSVYFRNLNNGPSFGINQGDNFAPASLLKVPLMMAYFKKAEKDPSVLRQELVFSEQSDGYLRAMQQIAPENYLQAGQSYSVDELIRHMIVYSDNDAMALLMSNFPQNDLYQIYGELGVTNPYDKGSGDVITVKDYASFFRILYNAAYLNKEDSEKALDLLSQATFRDGLVAGVSSDVLVAHKFGERELGEGDHPNQLHDCGIVYYAKYPYLLCVMTKGSDKDKLVSAIRNVSRITFEEISKNYPL